MVTKRIRNGHAKSAKMAANKWLDLPIGPLGQIFTNLSPIDMVLVVPLVCKDWGRILCEILFFKHNNNLLDFTPLRYEPFRSIFGGLEDSKSRAMKLMKFLVGVMHAFASDGTSAVRAIRFPHNLLLYDKHLVYVSKRCPELKSIFLLCAEKITGKGITRAMRFWTGMEEISCGPFCEPPVYGLHLSRTIEEIGINCKNLQFLELNSFDLHWQSAEIIVQNLKSLKLLCLTSVNVHKYGLQIFLSRCKKVDRVKFLCSFFVKSEGKEFVGEIHIMRIQEGRRTRWRTNTYPDEIGKLHTSKELVDLLWK